jgi:hypothetical protein
MPIRWTTAPDYQQLPLTTAVGGDRSLQTTVTEKRRTVRVNCQLATKRRSYEVRAAALSFLDGQERHHASAAVCAERKVVHGRRLLVREEPSAPVVLLGRFLACVAIFAL